MTFLYPQFIHPLIPQPQDSQATEKLCQTINESRQQYFALLQSQIAELGPQNLTKDYQLRQQLDTIPEIQQANQQRSQLQDKLWEHTLEVIESDRQRLNQVYEYYTRDQNNLELNPGLTIPAHQLKVNIHRMPGGYLENRGEDDFWTGLLYDHGVFLYGRGWLGPLNDEFGQTVIHQILKPHYPNFNPQKILDLGCSVGHSTLPYGIAYPAAEVWGIDLGASLLRYGNARAKALGQTIYFSQQNAEKTEFSANSFDLVVSHILMHEIPNIAKQRIFAESYRLLKTGGIMVHLDSLLFLSPTTPVSRYFRDTEVYLNSEPYLGSGQLADFSHYALEAGFNTDHCQSYQVSGYHAEQKGLAQPRWVAFCGVKK